MTINSYVSKSPFVSIDLALPSYLRSYLTAVYGDNYRVTTQDDFGLLILNTLRKKTSYYLHIKDREKRSEVYRVFISVSMFEKYGCSISEEQMFQIYKIIDTIFRRLLYINAIVNKESHSIPYSDSINENLKVFGIHEDELSYSTIRKDFNRKKGNLMEKLNLNKSFY